jgi:hypothetical protein
MNNVRSVAGQLLNKLRSRGWRCSRRLGGNNLLGHDKYDEIPTQMTLTDCQIRP